MKMLQRFIALPVFLVLLPLFFVLHGCAQNFPLIKFGDGTLLFLQYLLISIGLTALFRFVFRSTGKAAVYSFLLLSIQLFFGPAHDFLTQHFSTLFVSKYSFLLPLLCFSIVLGYIILKKRKRPVDKIITYLNVLFLLLVAIDVISLAAKMTTAAPDHYTEIAACTDCPKPNIYLILADEYAGQKELHDLFAYDNSAFELALKNRGFQVLQSPRSNYNYTPYSMASLFNMNYLEGISNTSSDFRNRQLVFQSLNANKVVSTFKALGYQFYNFSLFDFAGIPADRHSSNFYQVGKRIITSQTFTSRVKRDLWYHVLLDWHFNPAQNSLLNALKGDITKSFESTVEQASQKTGQPKFVYAHFIMPHYPYLYDEKGSSLSFEQSQKNDPSLYLGYLKYCNRFCLSLVDEIIRRDQNQPIIILMSDHGYTKYENSPDKAYNFTNIINVYNARPLPDTLTNVNLFRYLLNQQFKQQLPYLKDSTIFLSE